MRFSQREVTAVKKKKKDDCPGGEGEEVLIVFVLVLRARGRKS